MKDYYAILGVNRTASMFEIKRAYRQLAILYHPDKNPDPTAEQFFKEVNEAYDVLGDESKKNWYDYKSQVNTVQDSPQPDAAPRHRDPAYRRKRPPVTQRENKISLREIMLEYLPYFKWTSWAGMGLIAVLALDYYLPVLTSTEEILEIYGVRRYEIVVTPHHRILMDGGVPDNFKAGMQVQIQYTPFLRTVLKISDPAMIEVVLLRGIYGPVIILPFILFFTSGLGILSRKNKIEFFNLSVVNGILLFAIIYLIFSV